MAKKNKSVIICYPVAKGQKKKKRQTADSFHHILLCMVMNREKEPVTQLYTEFNCNFSSYKKKKQLKKKEKKKNCTQLYTILRK